VPALLGTARSVRVPPRRLWRKPVTSDAIDAHGGSNVYCHDGRGGTDVKYLALHRSRGLSALLATVFVTSSLLLAAPRLATAQPDSREPSTMLYSVAAVAADDVWAVGWEWTGSRYLAVAQHFDGRDWRSVHVPSPGVQYTTLLGVTAIGSRDVWAVGRYDNGFGAQYTLAEHWNGRRWSVVQTVNPQPGGDVLVSVDAISPDDVWAVGGYGAGQLIEHWDGAAWLQVSGDYGGVFDFVGLSGVTAIAGDDVWAVGEGTESDEGRPILPVAEHWDGLKWTMQNPPLVRHRWLRAVTAPSPSDVWAVGGRNLYIQHYDGAWHQLQKRRFKDRSLITVASGGPDDVWFAGGPDASILHWDGSQLTEVALHASPRTVIQGADALTPTDAWVVGYVPHGAYWSPIAEHWNGTAWTETITLQTRS
jgi:hypothetical protein